MDFEYIVKEKTDLKSFLLNNGYSIRKTNKLLLEKKDILINGKPYCGNYNLNLNDKVLILNSESTTVSPIEKEIDIVYEDEFILVVNKPSRISVIPSRAHLKDNLAGRVLYYFNSKKINSGIHVINRLDYDTSGITVFAKSSHIHNLLSKTEIEKKYRCTVKGVLKSESGVIDLKIARSGDGIKRVVAENGKPAITLYKVVKQENGNSLLDITLKTGRTHQIRVHMSHIGHPLIGDGLYGEKSGNFDLCSYYLSFRSPFSDKRYVFII